jgi:membrane fusion protein (multidrug efflux system)
MPLPLQRYGFAAAVVGAIALMALAVGARTLFGGDGEAEAAKAPMAGKMKGKGGGETPEVRAALVRRHVFSDAIQAIGTAQSRESIVITPKVADAIRAIRFESGDRVRAGQVLVELSSLEQQASLAEARATQDAAQRELQRFQELHERGFLPRARLDAAQAAFDAAEARVRAGLSRMADRTIRAPFAGIMGLRTASPGQFVRPGDAIGTLDDISEIKLDFDVAETQIARLASGVAITARTAAYPQQQFVGRIAQVDSRIAAQSRTVRVRALLPNADERLRAGMLMTVEIRSNPRDGLAVPEVAIIDEAQGASVFTVAVREGRPIAQLTRIETGQRVGGMVEIVRGLSEGQQVVVEGVNRVRPGQPVRLIARTVQATGGAS